MKIRGLIVGFNLFENMHSDVTIDNERCKGQKIKVEMSRESAMNMIREHGVDTPVTVTIGNGEDL